MMMQKDETGREHKRELFFEQEKMQQIQDVFSKANHVYGLCIDRTGENLTSFSGDAQEEAYFAPFLTEEKKALVAASFSDVSGENVIELPVDVEGVRMHGVAIRGENYYLQGAWVVLAVEKDVPSVKYKTNARDYEQTIALLEVLTSNYFANKSQLALLAENMQAMLQEEERMEYQLQKTEVLTELLNLMESEDPFSDVVEGILTEAGKYLKVTNAYVLKIAADGETVELVCQWSDMPQHKLEHILEKKIEYPFMTDRSYTISSDTIIPEPFAEYFARYDMRCGIFLPITINGKTGMYLCLGMRGQDRKWLVEEIKFVNDIKRVMQTILLKRVTKNSLASSYSALESILENSGCGVSVVDLGQGVILYKNDTYKAMELQPDDWKSLEALLLMEKESGDTEIFEARHSGKWYELSYALMQWVDGRQVRLVTIYDITRTKQYQEKMELQANTDYLTGAYNRKRLEEDLKAEIQQTVRSGNQCAILVIDLDDFNNINDGLGHQVGDQLLRQVADALIEFVLCPNSCYRVGGDEFLILVSHERIHLLQQIIEHVQQIFAKPWILGETQYYCTMSMGVVMVPKDGVESEILLQRADIALHSAKSKGKNRVEHYNNQQMSSVVERLDLEKGMREAVEKGCKEFEVYYQPLIDVTQPNNPCCGAEALVRWNSPTMGFVMPSQFIPMAEYLGLINEIGRHVLIEACKRCKYWNDFGHPEYKINVNLSVVQLMQNDIVDTIKEALDATQIMPNNLTLEVTEGLAINDMTRMQQILRQIKDMGIRVALDDFGTGYSSLSHIRRMPIDVIKIDRCFVEDIGEDVFSDAFVKSVSQLAEALNMNICVEGVEDEKQKKALNEMNVDMIQGYLFDKPLTAEDFERKYLF